MKTRKSTLKKERMTRDGQTAVLWNRETVAKQVMSIAAPNYAPYRACLAIANIARILSNMSTRLKNARLFAYPLNERTRVRFTIRSLFIFASILTHFS